MWGISAASLLLLALSAAQAVDNGVGRTPAMGWNSWNHFRCAIDEELIKEVADILVASGLRDAGYRYVNLDDCWQERRDVEGNIVPNALKFPSGIAHLADYVHERGLKLGLYSDTGQKTCENYPGSWGHEQQDADAYAAWGVDYLKYDYCHMQDVAEPPEESYMRMSRALNKTGRPIHFSLCNWGVGEPWKWGSKVGNSWRTDADLFAVWDDEQAEKLKLPKGEPPASFLLKPFTRAVKVVEALHEYAGPGGFNDPDMMVVGLEGMSPFGVVKDCPEHIEGCEPGTYISRERWGVVGGLTQTEQRTHFAMWCFLASPLMIGNDPRSMTKATLSILKAPELLAISQDPLGKQARKVWEGDRASIWVKPLADGRQAALLFNEGKEAVDMDLVFSRDMPEAAQPWARAVPGPDCGDKDPRCRAWAQRGECNTNSALMWERCRTSCPAACPKDPLPPGPKATALIRDAWQEDDLGPVTGYFQARLVEPHEARVLTLRFVEPEEGHKAVAARRAANRVHALAPASQGRPQAPSLEELKSKVAHLTEKLQQAEAQHVHDMRGMGGDPRAFSLLSAAVWGTWPGRLLMGGNIALLLMLLASQFIARGAPAKSAVHKRE